MIDEASQLRATLAKLQEQLAALGPSTGALNPEVRQRLETALADIHALLDKGGTLDSRADASKGRIGDVEGGEEESIVERLSAAERHFEQTHPTLAGIVGSIINALSRMGI
jgi:Domain of unknown function (DUF4404)